MFKQKYTVSSGKTCGPTVNLSNTSSILYHQTYYTSYNLRKWLFSRASYICLFGLFYYFVTLSYNREERKGTIKETKSLLVRACTNSHCQNLKEKSRVSHQYRSEVFNLWTMGQKWAMALILMGHRARPESKISILQSCHYVKFVLFSNTGSCWATTIFYHFSGPWAKNS